MGRVPRFIAFLCEGGYLEWIGRTVKVIVVDIGGVAN